MDGVITYHYSDNKCEREKFVSILYENNCYVREEEFFRKTC